MESFSRTLDNYTGSYLARRRRKRIVVSISVAAVVVLVGAAVVLFGHTGIVVLHPRADRTAKSAVLADWNAQKWNKVVAETTSSLTSAPMDPFYLMFKGFASFYNALQFPEGDNRFALLDDCVTALRMAIATKKSLPIAQVDYVLGKAYYLKGPSYFDESIKFLEDSIANGFNASDTDEYLAMAYAGLDEKARAAEYFKAALEKKKTPLLLVAAAKTYVDMGNSADAVPLLSDALSSSTDAVVAEKCHFMLGDIYRSSGDSAKAEEQYNLVLQSDPNSVEAHYRLGIIYQDLGEAIRARAEWRKALSIDPGFEAARGKLAEKF